WSDIGYAAVNTHDIPDGSDCNNTSQKPLNYTATIPFNPADRNCTKPLYPLIRATLSWAVIPPDDPKWSPVYGNSLDQHVQAPLMKSSSSALLEIPVIYPELFPADWTTFSEAFEFSNDTIDKSVFAARGAALSP